MSKIDESKIYVAFSAMIENPDNYKFFKNADGTHAIDVEIKGYKHSFKADDIYNLMNLVGNWLCKLPESIWV